MSCGEKTKALIWLSMSESLTARGRRLLLEEYGCPERVLREFGHSARTLIGDKAFRELDAAAGTLEAAVGRMETLGIRALTPEDAGFPAALRRIPDAPELLYIRGDYIPRPSVAIVGSRRDTRYGREMARRIARDLAEAGVTVVSGLARGIDTAAHQGAVQAGGVSVGVLGCGLDSIYPKENTELAGSMLRCGGCVISEYPAAAQPLPYHFPHRNRLISGLADGVLLIEATLRSGTQSTVNHALEQGKTVFALPGNVDAPGSELPLRLLKEGAELCTCASDIITHLGLNATVQPEEKAAPPAKSDDPVLNALEREEKTFEELLEETGVPAPSLTARLSLMELEGLIERRPGRAYALVRK